ncbi:MAG: hypothetical protein JW791_02310 [Nanoarchaeota archaeon]|nr:hypothetical protein [Nanoarchaeota archaeon]
MVGLSRKAFIRSVESVIAILLFISFYNLATQNLSHSLPRADPTIQARGLMDALEQSGMLNDYLNTYSLNELTNSLKYLLPPTQGFKIELNYLEPLIVTNNNNEQVAQNLSFVRFFPESTNLDSVNVLNKEGKILPLELINNYYKITATVQVSKELVNETITLDNVNLRTANNEAINTTSLAAFVEESRAELNLDSIVYNNNYYDANASITILVPYAEQNSVINIALFYASDESGEIINYPTLEQGIVLPYTTSFPIKSKASEVRFTAELEANEEQTMSLYYELNTEPLTRSFNSLTTDQDKVEVQTRKSYYASTTPLTSYQSTNTYNVRKTVVTSGLNCLINFKVWNYE